MNLPPRTAPWLARRRALLLALTLTLAMTAGARGEDIRMASMRLGTAWYVFSATLYKLLVDELPGGDRLEIMAKGGGIANPLLVSSGKVQVALANRATAVWAFEGNPLVYPGNKNENLRVLVGGLNTVPFSFIVREEYITRTGNDTLDKILKGDQPLRLVMKPRGSSAPVVADLIFAACGTSRERIRANGGRILQVSSKQIPNVLRNGQADVYVDLAPLGHPTVTEVSLTVPVRFLEVPRDIREALTKLGLRETSVPKFWKGQDGPFQTVDVGTVIIAHRDLSVEMAYLFTKTICENKDALSKAHKAWAKFEPHRAGTLESTGIRLHPGAARYYRERGWETE